MEKGSRPTRGAEAYILTGPHLPHCETFGIGQLCRSSMGPLGRTLKSRLRRGEKG